MLQNLFFLCTNLHFISRRLLVSNTITIKLNNSKHFMPAAYQSILCNTYASGCVHLKKKVCNENIYSEPSILVLNSGFLCTAQRNCRYRNNNLTNRKIKDLGLWSGVSCYKPLIKQVIEYVDAIHIPWEWLTAGHEHVMFFSVAMNQGIIDFPKWKQI